MATLLRLRYVAPTPLASSMNHEQGDQRHWQPDFRLKLRSGQKAECWRCLVGGSCQAWPAALARPMAA